MLRHYLPDTYHDELAKNNFILTWVRASLNGNLFVNISSTRPHKVSFTWLGLVTCQVFSINSFPFLLQFDRCAQIGRDFIRLLHGVARLEPMKRLWDDILQNISSLSSHFSSNVNYFFPYSAQYICATI